MVIDKFEPYLDRCLSASQMFSAKSIVLEPEITQLLQAHFEK